MATTVNPKPRFKERQSRSFRSLQLLRSKQEKDEFDRMENDQVNIRERFQPLRSKKGMKVVAPKSWSERMPNEGSAANQDFSKYKETVTPLDPIAELHTEKLDVVADMLKDKVATESDVQELLLGLTYTSGMLDDLLKNTSKQDAPLPNSSLSSLREALKKRWSETLLSLLDKLDSLQSKLFEYFWKAILYFNFWFPQLATVIRYVS